MTVTIKEKVVIAPPAATSVQPFAGLSTPVEAAQAYQTCGMALVPIPLGSKKPQLKGWPELQCDGDNIPSLFGGQLNIAVKLGSPSHGLVDIDLDTLEAIKLAPKFLPPTNCIFGRKAKPKSHYIYSVLNAGASLKRQAKIGQSAPTVLLELRSTGSLTVFPPSVHETGEQIEFDEGHAGLPTEVSELTLLGAVNELAVATLLARAWPKTAGTRNELAMALAGGMLRSGVPGKRVANLLQHAAEAAGDEEAKQRGDVVLATENKIKKMAPATGWPRVVNLLADAGAEVAQKSIEWLGLSDEDHKGSEFGGKLISVLASQVPLKAVQWLWPQWLPYGALSILDGDPSLGKSTLCLDLAARITTGAALPGGYACEPSAVVIVSCEDSLGSTVVPRLKAAGADLGKVSLVQHVLGRDGSKRPPSIPEDINLLAEKIGSSGARFVVIEPLVGYISLKANPHNDQQVRQALMPLVALAEETGAAILGVRHLNKQGGKQALYRGGGSIAMIGAARSGLIVAKNPDDPETRILACTKSNWGVLPKPWEYRLVSKFVVLDGSAKCDIGSIEWLGTIEIDADQLIADGAAKQPGAQAEAELFLAELLKHGPMKSEAIYSAGKEHGHAKKTLHRASIKLEIVKKPVHDGKAITGWTWKLAEKGKVDGFEQ